LHLQEVKLERGDLVILQNNFKNNKREDYAIVLEVRNYGVAWPQDVFLKFPLDGSEGWFSSSKLKKIENQNEQH